MNQQKEESKDQDQAQVQKQFRFASLGIRLAAAIVDLLVYFPLVLLGVYNFVALKSFGLDLLINFFPIIYKPLMEWKYGATLGKMVLKIKVVSKTSESISLDQAMARFTPFFIYQAIIILANFYLFSHTGFAEAVNLDQIAELQQNNRFAGVSSFASFLLTFSLLYMITNPFRQSLHDKLARTYCIQTTVRTES